MKKAIILLALMAITALTFAQNKTVNYNIQNADVVDIGSMLAHPQKTAPRKSSKKHLSAVSADTTKEIHLKGNYVGVPTVKPDTTYRPDPKRLYIIQLTAEQLQALVQTSQAGVIPFLETTAIKLADLKKVQPYYSDIYQIVSWQLRQQYLVDSLSFRNPKPVKNKK
jgi:hypothetical protein